MPVIEPDKRGLAMNETTARFAYIWEYTVRDDHLDQFRRAYGPSGKWVEFFSGAEGYITTELQHDLGDRTRFLTVDYWISKEARDEFRERHAAAFAALDRTCEALTVTEKFVGDFEIEPGTHEDP